MSKTQDNNQYKSLSQPDNQQTNINQIKSPSTIKKFSDKMAKIINSEDTETNTVFWLEDPTVYLKNKNYLKILPDYDMTRIEQLNAINLLAFYILVILFVLRLSNRITTFIFVGLIAITIILYFLKYYNTEPFIINDNKVNIESGFYTSDDDLIIGKFRSYKNCNNDLIDSTKHFKKPLNEIATLRREPTINNPYMNPILTDYNNSVDSNSVQPLNADDDSIHQEPSKTYDLDMFKDLNDIFDKKNAERQFYTVPGGTIPNDQQKFADWCYRTPITCKDDTAQCRVFEDMRYRSGYRN
jgi:hypothetical protein